METIIEGYKVELINEGTLDTVLRVDGKFFVRFDSEYASTFRNDDGSFEQEFFDRLAYEAFDDFLMDRQAKEEHLYD